MKPVSSPTQPTATESARDSGGAGVRGEEWADRAGRLYVDLEAPARAMVRRAFRDAFSDDDLDDIYSSAWVGTLRTLERRHADLSDEEVRRYLLAAVANHASKELRRRRRKPTAPLEAAGAAPDGSGTPDERAIDAERSRIARDLLVSLPERRRAVMLLRYGWGLEPHQVCELVEGLSPRAYRKEITRGVDELTERMRRLETGEWCAEREPVLKAYAAGLADADQRRQAQAHLAHCRECTDFVTRLSGHLHDLGTGVAPAVALDSLGGGASLGDRVDEAGERVRETVGGLLVRGGGEGVPEAAGQALAAGGTRGAGTAAGAGLLAKLTGLGTAGKVAAVCLSGGAAATACVSAGVVPGIGAVGGGDREHSAPREPGGAVRPAEPVLADLVAAEPAVAPGEGEGVESADASPEQEAVEPPEPVAPDAPVVEQEFGVAAAASGSSGGGGSGGSGGGGSAGSGGGGGGSAVQREFGGP